MKRLLFIIIMLLSLALAGCGGNEKNISQVQQNTKNTVQEMNDEQYQNLIKTFADCEFNGNFTLTRTKNNDNLTGAGEISFVAEDEFKNTFLVCFAPNNTVYRIVAPFNYDVYSNGKVNYKASDFILTKKEKQAIINVVQTHIKENLTKSNLSIKNIEFWDIYDWGITKTPDGIKASSYFVLPNAEGQRKRTDFNAVLDKTGKQVISIHFSGKLADKAPEKNESLLHSLLN